MVQRRRQHTSHANLAYCLGRYSFALAFGAKGGKCEFAGSQRGLSDPSDADLRRARAISVTTWPKQMLSRTVQLART